MRNEVDILLSIKLLLCLTSQFTQDSSRKDMCYLWTCLKDSKSKGLVFSQVLVPNTVSGT